MFNIEPKHAALDVLVGTTLNYGAGARAHLMQGRVVPKLGILLNRADHPKLYQHAVDTGQIVSEAEWQRLAELSVGRAMTIYSHGDGATTFRVPSVGSEALMERPVGTAGPKGDVSDTRIGHGDAMRRIHGEFSTPAHHGNQGRDNINTSGMFEQRNDRHHIFTVTSTTANEGLYVKLDTSKYIPTADEVRVKFSWCSAWIYSGGK